MLGLGYGLAGVLLLVAGGSFLTNTDPGFESPGFALIGVGSFLIVVGAVARGLQLARR